MPLDVVEGDVRDGGTNNLLHHPLLLLPSLRGHQTSNITSSGVGCGDGALHQVVSVSSGVQYPEKVIAIDDSVAAISSQLWDVILYG